MTEDITVANKTKKILWEQKHPLSMNSRTGEQMPLETFCRVFNRKFKNLTDIVSITEILRLNKEVTTEAMQEYNTLVAWHKGLIPTQPAHVSQALDDWAIIPPPDTTTLYIPSDEEEMEEQGGNNYQEMYEEEKVWTPSYPRR